MEYLLINIGKIEQEIINDLPTSVASFFELARVEEVDHIRYVYKKYQNWFLHPNQNRIRRIIIMFFNRMLRSLHIDGSEFKEIRELEEVGSMLCDIDTWPEKWMQIGMREGEEKGIEKGEKMQARKIALRMLEKEKSIAEIAELTDLTEKEILELIDDIIDK